MSFVKYEIKRLIDFLSDREDWLIVLLGYIAFIILIFMNFVEIQKLMFYAFIWGFTLTIATWTLSDEYKRYRGKYGK